MPRRPRPGRPRLVTLTSDLGAVYTAQMKAVLARHLPPGSIVDLAHDLPRHDVREAAFLLRSMAVGFPAGSVHVVVVDPGVGGPRAPLAIACGDGSYLVGPDNGVLSLLAKALGAPRAFRLDPAKVGGGPRIGTTFDGRDLFAPAAARLAKGTPPERLGRPTGFLRLPWPEARRTRTGVVGEIVHVDRFGNLISNVPSSWAPPRLRSTRVTVGRRARPRSLPWAVSYEALGAGVLGLLASSFGFVEIAVAEGSAAARLRAGAGDPVALRWTRGVRAPVRR